MGGPIGYAFAPPAVDDYEHAIGVLRQAREVGRLLGINPRLPHDALSSGLGDVELLHNLLTVGEHEGDGSRARFDGRTPTWTEYTERLAASKGEPMDFEANPAGRDATWTFVGQQVKVPISRLTLSKAKCSATKMADGMIQVIAEGTPGSRFWVKRSHPEDLSPSAAPDGAPDDAAGAGATG